MRSGMKVAVVAGVMTAALAMAGGAFGASAGAASSADSPSVTGKVIAVNGDVSVGTCGTADHGNFIVKSGIDQGSSQHGECDRQRPPSVDKQVTGATLRECLRRLSRPPRSVPTPSHSLNASLSVSSSPKTCQSAWPGHRRQRLGGPRRLRNGQYTWHVHLDYKVGRSTVVDRSSCTQHTKFHDPDSD